MDTLLRYDLADGIAIITMDDGKANVMSVAMLQAINTALDRAQAEAAVVMLKGRDGMFSGGFDLAVFKGDAPGQLRMLEAGARLTERLLSFPQPVLAVCTGHAVAMGAFLLLSADVRIGIDQGARIQANEVAIGMTLPHFAIEVCRQRLAPAQLCTTALTAYSHTPQEAVAAGFLDHIVAADSLNTAALAHASRLRKLHAPSFTATKLRLRQAMLEALRQAIRDDLDDWNARIRDRA